MQNPMVRATSGFGLKGEILLYIVTSHHSPTFSDVLRRSPTFSRRSTTISERSHDFITQEAKHEIFSKSTTLCTTPPNISDHISDTRYLIRQPLRTPHTTPDLIRIATFIIVADTAWWLKQELWLTQFLWLHFCG